MRFEIYEQMGKLQGEREERRVAFYSFLIDAEPHRCNDSREYLFLFLSLIVFVDALGISRI